MVKRKILPKTPADLFDSVQPANNQENENASNPQKSHSPSPIPRKSPTPSKIKQNNNIFLRFFKSRIIFYGFALLSIILSLTLTKDLIVKSYCSSDSENTSLENDFVDCIPCPENAKCSFGHFVCAPEAYQYNEKCILQGSDEDKAINLMSTIDQIITSRSIKTFNELLNSEELKDIDTHIVKLSFELSDKYLLINDKIETNFSPDTIKLILYLSLGFCTLVFIISLIARCV